MLKLFNKQSQVIVGNNNTTKPTPPKERPKPCGCPSKECEEAFKKAKEAFNEYHEAILHLNCAFEKYCKAIECHQEACLDVDGCCGE